MSHYPLGGHWGEAMTSRKIALIVFAVLAIGLLAAVALVVAANYGVDFVVPNFKL